MRIEWASAAEGTRFAAIASDFTAQLKELGPLWKGGEEKKRGNLKLAAVKKLVPYIKLMEAGKLPISPKNNNGEEDLEKDRLICALIEEKVVLSQILSLIHDRHWSVEEIADFLHISRTATSKILALAANRGMLRWDPTGFIMA